MPNRTRPNPDIDFVLLEQLRGIAAMAVVVGHSRGLLYVGGTRLKEITPIFEWGISQKVTMALLSLTRLAPEFVIFFFILSGFSIAHSLSSSTSIRGFYLRRALRLYPTYLGGLLWAAIVFYLLLHWKPDFFNGTYDHPSFRGMEKSLGFLSPWIIILNLLYLPQGIFIEPYWSLTHEVIFYAIAPLIFLNTRIYLMGSLLLYIWSWATSGWGWSEGGTLRAFLLDYNVYFAAGIFLYLNWESLKEQLRFSKPTLALILGFCYLASVLLGLTLGSVSKFSALLFSFASALLIVDIHFSRWKSRPALFIGKLSYSLYISHFSSLLLLLAIIHSFIKPPYILNPIVWLLGPPFALLFSILHYRAFEHPSQRIISRLREISRGRLTSSPKSLQYGDQRA